MTRRGEPELPDVPGWDDDLVRDELDYQRGFAEQNRQEEARLRQTAEDSDPLGLSDGRPGLDPELGLMAYLAGEADPFAALPRSRNYMLLAVVALLVTIVLVLRICPSLRQAAQDPPRPAPAATQHPTAP